MGYTKMGQFGGLIRQGMSIGFGAIRSGVASSVEFVLSGGTNGVFRSHNYDPTNEEGWALFGDGSVEIWDFPRLDDVETELGALTTFTPTLQAGGGNPNLGTGGDVSGQYSVVNGWCHGWVRWRFGTSGTSAGSGGYFFTPPVAAHASVIASSTSGEGSIVGHGWIRDDSTPANSVSVMMQPTSSGFQFVPADDRLFVSSTNPWGWTSNDRITGYFSYPVA